jgi:hypothetical protein
MMMVDQDDVDERDQDDHGHRRQYDQRPQAVSLGQVALHGYRTVEDVPVLFSSAHETVISECLGGLVAMTAQRVMMIEVHQSLL